MKMMYPGFTINRIFPDSMSAAVFLTASGNEKAGAIKLVIIAAAVLLISGIILTVFYKRKHFSNPETKDVDIPEVSVKNSPSLTELKAELDVITTPLPDSTKDITEPLPLPEKDLMESGFKILDELSFYGSDESVDET